ncbi:ADO2 [Symbiodinium sp. KB8]|nr:ADO2 [Symbiodinium sp. KB8]
MNSARRMWIYGGEADTTGTAFLNDLWYIDVEDSSDSWHQVSVSGTAPTARSEHAAVLSATGRMWIYGGIGASGILSDVWYIDVEVGSPSWVQMIASGSNPGPRRAHSAALTADNEMWIFSGYFVEGGVDDELWYLEAASPAWVSAGEWTNARYDHASGITASGRAVVFGGYSGSSAMNDLWTYDTQASSSSWSEISTCCPPSARYSHTAVMTPAGRMWICGGWDGSSTYGDLWYIDVEDPSPSWSQVYPSSGFMERREHVAVITPTGRMWVFGGKDGTGASYDSLQYIDLEAASPQWITASPGGNRPPALLKPSAAQPSK